MTVDIAFIVNVNLQYVYKSFFYNGSGELLLRLAKDTQLNILLKILLHETQKPLQNERSKYYVYELQKKFRDDFIRTGYANSFRDENITFRVSSSQLETSVNRVTFSENKEHLVDSFLINKYEVRKRKAGSGSLTYYSTTPLGKVLAMKFWLSENTQVDAARAPTKIPELEISKKITYEADFWKDDVGSVGSMIVDPSDLLATFYQYLPKLKELAASKETLLGVMKGTHKALRIAFFDIDINQRVAYTTNKRKIPIQDIIYSKRLLRRPYGNVPLERNLMEKGQMSPVTVYKTRNGYKLVDGYKRLNTIMGFKKYGQSGWDTIDAIEIIKEYGVEVNFSGKNKTQVRLIKYFKMDDEVEKMHDYILDSLTFIFLRNLKAIKKELDDDYPLVTKILNGASLKSFYKQYQSDAQRAIRGTIS